MPAAESAVGGGVVGKGLRERKGEAERDAWRVYRPLVGARPELGLGGDEGRSQEVCHGHGAGSTGIEGSGRSEGALREMGTGEQG